jgi:hypothetical protein
MQQQINNAALQQPPPNPGFVEDDEIKNDKQVERQCLVN